MLRIATVLSTIIILLWRTLGTRGQTTIFPIFKQDEAIRNAKSREILNYMNQTIDPCEDFYEYACGNWYKYHMPNSKHEVETPQTLLNHKINKDLHKILDENVTVDDSAMARKVKTFYKSCLDAKRNEHLQQVFMNEFVKSNGGFPAAPGSNWLVHHHNYDWQHIIAGLRYNYGMDILIGMDIDINYQSLHENSIYLGEPSTLIPRHFCSYRGTQEIEITNPEYDTVEAEVADNLKLWLSLNKEESLKLAADIVTFEYDLCTAMFINETEDFDFIGSRSPDVIHKKYARKTLIDFSNQLQNRIDFNAIVRESFGVPIYKPVFMKSPQYFQQLVKVVDEYNTTSVANYIMYRALSFINLPLNDTPHSRPPYCLQVVKKYFPKVLGEMYHRKHANSVDQDEMETVFDKLKEMFDASLRKDWIEDSTARLGKTKLAEMKIYFPTYEKDTFNLEFSRNDYWNNLKLIMAEVRAHELSRVFATGLPKPKEEVEAYDTRMVYRPYHKRIDVGWGILQAPYYQPQLPNSMRFAVIGQKLAETLANAFDDYGWTADTIGHNNWDPNTAIEFYKRANCFREQISNYLYNDPDCFHNATKTREIIAKSAALNTAFNAYLDWLKYQNPNNDHPVLSKETLADLNFTNTQLFFITFAQMHCKARKKSLKKLEPSFVVSPLQRHTMTRYEVNGALRNSKEFATDFGCSIGSAMNVADKCIIY